jgi:sialate O-acetylesterase
MRGIIWWQGEADTVTYDEHHILLPALIRTWRSEWGQGDFPFLYVQLPNGKGLPYGRNARRLPPRIGNDSWQAVLRQAFVETLAEPNTDLVITGDLIGGIHPPLPARPEYAKRLSDAARVLVYGESFTYSGPIVEAAHAEPGGGVRISYRPLTATGLHAGGGDLQGFALSDDGENWFWATPTIDGDEVVVTSDEVVAPVAVRYGYGRRYEWANLYNDRNLLAGAFEAPVLP